VKDIDLEAGQLGDDLRDTLKRPRRSGLDDDVLSSSWSPCRKASKRCTLAGVQPATDRYTTGAVSSALRLGRDRRGEEA
jgi:hypothetical protein